ncbi:MAG: YlxR family protein [Dehalococcoidia bacterium]|nr:YlxR family protein [Dehalococcoidia bacterium]
MVSSAKPGAVRHVPQRTCVSCRQPAAKRKLVRVVRLVGGAVEVDSTGKKSGRGAYLCCNRACWETALRKKSLERALKTTISPEDRAVLESYSRDIPQDRVEDRSPPTREV